MARSITLRSVLGTRPIVGFMGGMVLALGCGTSLLRAELTWAQKTIDLFPDASVAAVVEARYRFSNDGKTPVDIQQIRTSCGCTTAELEHRHYDPGQSGEIVARFTVGDRVGLQRKTILISTSDHPFVPTSLALIAHLPEFVRLEPGYLVWNQGEAPTIKSIQVTAAPGASVPDIISVASSNRALAAVLQPGAGPGKFVIEVTPAATDRPQFATLVIRCRLAGGREKDFHAVAAVQPIIKARPAPFANQAIPAVLPQTLTPSKD